MQKLSSDGATFYKRVLPAMFGFLVLFVAVVVSDGPPRGVAVILGIVAIPFVLILIPIWTLMDEVYDCGDFLLVRNGCRETQISLHDIAKASSPAWTKRPRIWLTLARPCTFGRRISFIPVGRPISTDSMTSELTARAEAARRHGPVSPPEVHTARLASHTKRAVGKKWVPAVLVLLGAAEVVWALSFHIPAVSDLSAVTGIVKSYSCSGGRPSRVFFSVRERPARFWAARTDSLDESRTQGIPISFLADFTQKARLTSQGGRRAYAVSTGPKAQDPASDLGREWLTTRGLFGASGTFLALMGLCLPLLRKRKDAQLSAAQQAVAADGAAPRR